MIPMQRARLSVLIDPRLSHFAYCWPLSERSQRVIDNSRHEYNARIHRAQDFIEKHLDRELVLEDVAAAAHFSPFHFHRIYHAMTG